MLGKQLLMLTLCREQTPDRLIKIANVIPKKKGLQVSQRNVILFLVKCLVFKVWAAVYFANDNYYNPP